MLELHYRCGHGNATLFFHFHPVGSRVAGGLAAFHRTRQLNGAAKQQQFFCKGSFPSVWMGDDGEGPATVQLVEQFGHGWQAGCKFIYYTEPALAEPELSLLNQTIPFMCDCRKIHAELFHKISAQSR